MAAPRQGRRVDARPDRDRDAAGHGGRRGLRLVARERSGVAALDRRRVCRVDPQHALHRATVLHLLRAAGGRLQAVAGGRVGDRDGDEPRRLRDRDHPRRHRGDAAGAGRGSRQPGPQQDAGFCSGGAAAGAQEGLAGDGEPDHHRDAGFRGVQPDLDRGTELCGQPDPEPELSGLRGVHHRDGHLSRAVGGPASIVELGRAAVVVPMTSTASPIATSTSTSTATVAGRLR
ncbi:hypothetical protein VARIO8X_60025 [Burkholderiales bacterium 8X]|nr:hypothetical protein VARIO8X_60025 [Burkholderiales bacterium 8X]